MRIIITTFTLILLCSSSLLAQQKNTKTNSYEYYIEITGIDTKVIIQSFELKIKSKKIVNSFNGYGFPRSFYILRCKIPLTHAQFEGWVANKGYRVRKFENGVYDDAFLKNKIKGISKFEPSYNN